MLSEKSAGLVFFRRDNGEITFLILHYDLGHWGFSRGVIEADESEKEAAIREGEEETCLTNFKFVDDFKERVEYFYRRDGETVHKEVTYFLVETEEKDVKLSYEHQGYEWLDHKKALNRLSFNNDKKILRKAMKIIMHRSIAS